MTTSRQGATLIELQSTITCPACGFATAEAMPADACQIFYDCRQCGLRMKPAAGDCCVFCTYGTVPCPPIQMQAAVCLQGKAIGET